MSLPLSELSPGPSVSVLHLPDDLFGLVRAIGTEPDQLIQGVPVAIEGMEHLHTGLGSASTDPPMTGVGKIVEPLEGEKPQVGQNQRASRQPFEQVASTGFLVLVGVLAV